MPLKLTMKTEIQDCAERKVFIHAVNKARGDIDREITFFGAAAREVT